MLWQSLETDTLYQEQNGEIARLTEELTQLKGRLGSMGQELHRALGVVQEQSLKMRQLEAERGGVHAHFKEELDKVTS